jgi:SagB-type dehydrogenase family enzyme
VIPSALVAGLVYGEGVARDDPAETYHEASRLLRDVALAQMPGVQLLRDEPVLRASVDRAARRHTHRRSVDLDDPLPLRIGLGAALRRRRSRLETRTSPLPRRALATLLAAAYGAHRLDGGRRRPVPSGGALYPLELYPAVLAVEGVMSGVYHYDPYARRLADLDRSVERLRDALVYPSLAASGSVAIVITGVFWRSRFKYGQRGYRFTLLEAGHVAQNLVLAAAGLEVSALPLGGFYDREVERAIGVDGIDESALYIVLVGGAS